MSSPSSTAADSPVLRGVVHPLRRRTAAYWMAGCLTVFALFSAFPAAWWIAEGLGEDSSGLIPRWTYLSLLPSLLLMCLAVWAVLLPDWSTLYGAAAGALLMTVAYAVMLGVTVSAGPGSSLVAALELSDLTASRQAARWCFVMVCLGLLLTYVAGRQAARWRVVAGLQSRLGEPDAASPWRAPGT